MRFTKSSVRLAVILFAALTSAAHAVNTPLKFGVMSLGQPARIHAQWQPFVDYLKEKTGQEIEIVIPRGFKKINQAIAQGEVDFFYTNSLVFYRLQQGKKAIPLAQMENITNRTVTSGVIFVRTDSNINSIEDLKGKNFAFVSPMGVGGYLAPKALFRRHGIDTKVDLTEHFTKNLSSSIHRVILKEDHAGIMCGINYKLISKKIDTSELKVIANTDDYPETLIGIRPSVPGHIRKLLSDSILKMELDAKGKVVLEKMKSMKINRFVNYDKKTEEIISKLLSEAKM